MKINLLLYCLTSVFLCSGCGRAAEGQTERHAPLKHVLVLPRSASEAAKKAVETAMQLEIDELMKSELGSEVLIYDDSGAYVTSLKPGPGGMRFKRGDLNQPLMQMMDYFQRHSEVTGANQADTVNVTALCDALTQEPSIRGAAVIVFGIPTTIPAVEHQTGTSKRHKQLDGLHFYFGVSPEREPELNDDIAGHLSDFLDAQGAVLVKLGGIDGAVQAAVKGITAPLPRRKVTERKATEIDDQKPRVIALVRFPLGQSRLDKEGYDTIRSAHSRIEALKKEFGNSHVVIVTLIAGADRTGNSKKSYEFSVQRGHVVDAVLNELGTKTDKIVPIGDSVALGKTEEERASDRAVKIMIQFQPLRK